MVPVYTLVPVPTLPRLLQFLSLRDEINDTDTLTITVKDAASPAAFRIHFTRALAYAAIDEQFRMKAIDVLARQHLLPCPIVEVTQSDWLAFLTSQSAGLLEGRAFRHFLLMTTDSCVDVLCSDPPWIEQLAPP